MHEQKPPQSARETDLAQVEAQMESEIRYLRKNPTIHSEDLFSSNKMHGGEYPDRPGIRVVLDKPLALAISSRSDVTQELSAVLVLGENTTVGVVTARNKTGQSARYISLVSANPSEEGRAKLLGALKPGEPFTIGRDLLRSVAGRQDLFSTVGGTHCTIEIKDDVLTVVDENSTNGTSLFTNTADIPSNHLLDAYMWSQPTVEAEALFTEHESERIQGLGRFAADNSA